jgi:hypothetical protein
MKIHTKLNDDLPCGTLYDGWNLIIIYKLQFQVVFSKRNFSDHGANIRISALMQGLADGYFVPYTIGDYLSPD